MTSKKTGISRMIAFVTAFALFLTLTIILPPGAMTAQAEFENAVPVEQTGMTITAFSVKLNGTELTKGDTVRNGDQLALTFKWELPNDHEYTDSVFVCSLADKLNGINLPNQTIPVGNIAVYTILDNQLYIQLLEGSIGRSGSCELSGTISVTEDDVDEDGKFTLKFFDKSIEVIAPEFTTPGLYITKGNSGPAEYNAAERCYYQKFSICVGSNGRSSSNISVKDFGTDLYDFSSVTADKVTVYKGDSSEPVTLTDSNFTSDASGFSLSLGTVYAGWDNRLRIEYKVKVVSDKLLDPSLSWDSRKNTAQVYADDKLQQTSSGYVQFDPPSVSKAGVLSEDKSKITWTVTVNLNDYKDEFMSSDKTIELKDILDSNITDKTAFAAIFGESGVKTLSSADFTDGKYTVTYVTAVPDSYKNSAVSKTLGNKAEITYEDDNTKSAETSVTIPGSIGEFVTKSCSLEDNGDIKWTVAIDIPNVNNISSIEISDYMDVNKPFITSGTEFYVIDGNNVRHPLSDVGSRGWYSDQQFFINITNTSFINNNKNDTIQLVYTTPTNDVTKVTNTATVNIKFSDNTSASDKDSAIYALPGTKEAFYLDRIGVNGKESLKGAMAWHISVTKSGSYAAGDVITVTDTLPAGLEYVSGSLAINPANPYWFDPNNTYKNCVSVDGNMTITITVSAALAEALNKSDSKAIDIAYITQMTNDEYLDWLIGGIERGYTNNATISFNNESAIPINPATQYLTPDSTDIVNKFVSGTQKPTLDDPNYYATYTVKINEEALRLNEGNTFSAEDSLGTRLEYANEYSITPSDGVSFIYENSSNKISISDLQDETAYTITYKVKVNQIYLSDSYSDDEIGNMFGNTIAVTLGGTNRIGSSTCLDEGTYRSKGDYSFNQSGYTLTIKGTKAWARDSSSIRPSKIRIKLEVKKYVTENSPGAVETQKETSTKEYTITPNVQADDSWAYTIDDLPLYLDSNTDGKIRYSYTVSEVKIDGYEASYQLDSTNSTNISTLSVSANGNPNEITIGDTKTADAVCTLDITNTFTAKEIEKGKLTVNKSWINKNNDPSPPSTITFDLTDETGVTYPSKTIGSTETSVEFTDLPLFTYSRSTDSSGNEILVRTPRRYTLTEAPVTGYTTTYSERTFTLTDSASNTANINKTVTVVNSYNTVPTNITPLDIKINKTINGKNSSIAESAVFTLYGSDANGDIDYNNEINTARPTLSTNGKYNVIFYADGCGLTVGSTYYVVETTPADNCDLNLTIYKCEVGSDGKIMYSINESAFADANVLTCDNISHPHDISLIKTYTDTDDNSVTPTAEEIAATKFTLADTAYGSNFAPITKSPTFDGINYTVTFTENDGVKSGRTYIIYESSSPDTFTPSGVSYYCIIDDAGNVSYSTDLNGTPTLNPPTFKNVKIDTPVGPVTIEPLKLIKTYKAEDGSDSAPSESERVETKFTLSDTDPASGFADVTRFPVLVGGEYVVTFTETDGLKKGSTYMLRETGSPDTFSASEAVYYCRIDNDGKVSYSTDLNGTYSDNFIPSFTNIRTGSSDINVTPGTICLIKTYRTAEGSAAAPTDDILRSTVFTLTCADDETFIRTASPVWDGIRATVTFSEGLVPGYTYLLRETSAPEGYTAGGMTYYCKVGDDGYVSYSTDGVNYSSDFPECVNVRNSSDGPVGPDNPDPDNPNYPDHPDYPDLPYYPTYPYVPVYPPYYPVEEVPEIPLPVDPDNFDDVSSGAGITDTAEEGSSNIGAIALAVFFSSLIATAAAGIFGKKRHNR